jgi:hypothetical protein
MRKATRKLRRRLLGGGNDPSCGCDMQAGWPKFLTDNIPLPSVGPSQPTGQFGGGTCGAPPIPNYYQGGSQSGGGCAACSGLLLQQQGGGQPTYYNSNPVPDACPFPGTGYCNFYARGGSNPVSFSGSVEHNNGTHRIFRGTFNNDSTTKPITVMKTARVLHPEGLRPLAFRGKRLLWDSVENGVWMQNLDGSKGAWVGKLSPDRKTIDTTAHNYIVKGGANYGEPMYLQARLRGGYRPTKKNLAALKKWRKGQSIGFTMTSSLKAKGLIPRTSRKHKGKKVVSAKYK